MFIELVSKEVSWSGDKGVRIDITARGKVVTDTPTNSCTIIDPIHICLHGMDTCKVSLKLGSYTSVHQVVKGELGISIDVGDLSYYKGRDHTSRDEWIALVHDWVEAQHLREEWEEEAIEYRWVLSQVDLPGNSISVYSEPSEKNIIYKLVTGKDDFYISMIVEVRPALSYVTIALVQADDLRENYTYIGECSLTLPITSDSVKAVVGPAIKKFMSQVDALLELPLSVP